MNTKVQFNYEKIAKRAVELGQVHSFLENLFLLSCLSEKNAEVRSVMTHPLLSSDDKVSFLKDLPGMQGSSFYEEVLTLLIDTHELTHITRVYDQLSLLFKELGFLLIQLETAVSLSDSFKEQLTTRFKTLFNTDIILKVVVNESLVAGSLIRLPGGQVYDFSYLRSLSDFKHYLRERN